MKKNKNCGYQKLRALNDLAYKIENGLLKLVESWEYQRESGDLVESLMAKESNATYTTN